MFKEILKQIDDMCGNSTEISTVVKNILSQIMNSNDTRPTYQWILSSNVFSSGYQSKSPPLYEYKPPVQYMDNGKLTKTTKKIIDTLRNLGFMVSKLKYNVEYDAGCDETHIHYIIVEGW